MNLSAVWAIRPSVGASRPPRWAALALVLAASACAPGLRILSSSEPAVPRPTNQPSHTDATATTAARHSALKVLTFNAGLAPVIPRAEERAPEIAEALAAEDFDVACLQEVWLERHARQIQSALGGAQASSDTTAHGRRAAPEWISFPPESVAGLHCGDAELTSLVGCVAKKCRGETGVASCAVQSCRSVLEGLSAACVACLSQDLSDPLAALAGCTAPSAAETGRPAAPAAPTPKPNAGDADSGPTPTVTPYLLGGSYGTALVSRLPVLERDLTRLKSTMHPRGVIHARVLHPTLGPVDAYCTHLTPFLRGVKHPHGGSFMLEQSAQIERLIELTQPRGNVPVVLLGDLNAGPAQASARPPYQARMPQHYARLLGSGLRDATAAGGCSFCYDNPLQRHPDTGGLRIDHVLTRGFAALPGSQRRLFATPSLSDHYGIYLELVATSASQ